MRHSVIRAFIAAAVVGLAACGRAAAPASEPAGTAPPPAPGAASAGESIYGLDLALTDDRGRSLHLADLGGRPVIAAMVYTSCDAVCPRITEEMKIIEKQLSAADRARVSFVLFSLDPGRDTPEALAKFADAHQLDRSRWRLLAASEDDVRDLSAVLGVKYKRESDGEIAHSAMVFLIGADGVVRHRQVGLGEDPGALVAALQRLAS